MASPIETITSLVVTVWDLAKGAFILAIPLTILAWLALKLRARIQDKFKFSWAISTFFVLLLLCFILGILMYFTPLWLAISEIQPGLVPDYFQPTLSETALFYFYAILRVLAFAIILALLLLPFAFIGSFFQSLFNPKIKHALLSLFAAIVCTTFIAVALLLFVIPYVPLGLVYFLYAYAG